MTSGEKQTQELHSFRNILDSFMKLVSQSCEAEKNCIFMKGKA